MIRFTEEELSERLAHTGATINPATSVGSVAPKAATALIILKRAAQPATVATEPKNGKPGNKREAARHMTLRSADSDRATQGRSRVKRRNDEHEAQVRLVSCCRTLSDSPPELGFSRLGLLHAVPNGGKRDRITAAKLKAEGQLSGVPDLSLPVACRGYHGMYIEMKANRNTTTINQKGMLQALAEGGYYCAVCYSASEAMAHILWYLGVSLSSEARNIVTRYDMLVVFDRAGNALHPNSTRG